MSEIETPKNRSRLSRVGRWAAELLLVFVGVYAAFWLNNYQQHRQDAERRDQILASLEQQLREGIASGKTNRRERGTDSRGVSARARCWRDAAAASVCFYDRLQPN